MKHRLFIVEGLPCSGKSTISGYIAGLLSCGDKVCFVDEGSGDHPADYEFHALVPSGLLSDEEMIVPLADYSAEVLEKLLPYKIYDGLPWEKEMPVMLGKWMQFVDECDDETVYVFNCVLLQNPMCETMMRFGFTEELSAAYIARIAGIIQPLDPVVIYLKNDDIEESVLKASAERNGWLDSVIDYHVNGAYGRSISAAGFEGYISCLKERQQRELNILEKLPLTSLVIDNGQRNWPEAHETMKRFLLSLGALSGGGYEY